MVQPWNGSAPSTSFRRAVCCAFTWKLDSATWIVERNLLLMYIASNTCLVFSFIYHVHIPNVKALRCTQNS